MVGSKGQFYIITALILISAVYFTSIGKELPASEYKDYSSGQIENEMVSAVNTIFFTGQNSQNMEDKLGQFIDFVQNTSTSRGKNLQILAVVLIPENTTVNASIGNFLPASTSVNLTIAGQSQIANTVPESFTRIQYSSVPSNFTVEVSYSSTYYSFNTSRKLVGYFDLNTTTDKSIRKTYIYG